MEAPSTVATTPPTIVGVSLENEEKSPVGEIEPTRVVVDDMEHREAPPTTTDRSLTIKDDSLVNVSNPASVTAGEVV